MRGRGPWLRVPAVHGQKALLRRGWRGEDDLVFIRRGRRKISCGFRERGSAADTPILVCSTTNIPPEFSSPNFPPEFSSRIFLPNFHSEFSSQIFMPNFHNTYPSRTFDVFEARNECPTIYKGMNRGRLYPLMNNYGIGAHFCLRANYGSFLLALNQCAAAQPETRLLFELDSKRFGVLFLPPPRSQTQPLTPATSFRPRSLTLSVSFIFDCLFKLFLILC
jgi:hypothetical protein